MAKTKLIGTELIPERKKQYLPKYSGIQLAAVMPFVLVGYMPKFQELPLETLFVWGPSLLPSPWSHPDRKNIQFDISMIIILAHGESCPSSSIRHNTQNNTTLL